MERVLKPATMMGPSTRTSSPHEAGLACTSLAVGVIGVHDVATMRPAQPVENAVLQSFDSGAAAAAAPQRERP